MQNIIGYIEESIQTKEAIRKDEKILNHITLAVMAILDTFRGSGMLLLAGNGGSAADAQHVAAEFVNRFNFDRKALPALALSVDSSVITSISNDSSFNNIYVRQLEAYADKNDIFFGITTSGNSENIVRALDYCQEHGIQSIVLTGEDGGKAGTIADIVIRVPSSKTPVIQEAHLMIEHIICGEVERKFFDKVDF